MPDGGCQSEEAGGAGGIVGGITMGCDTLEPDVAPSNRDVGVSNRDGWLGGGGSDGSGGGTTGIMLMLSGRRDMVLIGGDIPAPGFAGGCT